MNPPSKLRGIRPVIDWKINRLRNPHRDLHQNLSLIFKTPSFIYPWDSTHTDRGKLPRPYPTNPVSQTDSPDLINRQRGESGYIRLIGIIIPVLVKGFTIRIKNISPLYFWEEFLPAHVPAKFLFGAKTASSNSKSVNFYTFSLLLPNWLGLPHPYSKTIMLLFFINPGLLEQIWYSLYI